MVGLINNLIGEKMIEIITLFSLMGLMCLMCWVTSKVVEFDKCMDIQIKHNSEQIKHNVLVKEFIDNQNTHNETVQTQIKNR